MSVVGLASNVCKSLVGEGILSLPAGIAAGTGLVPGLLVMGAFCFVMMYSFWSIGRCCEAANAKTHGEVGLALGGRTFAFFMELTNLLKSGLACAAYALVIGRNTSDILSAFGFEGWYSTPRLSFLTVLLLVLLPLCLLRDLSKLAFSSLFGLLCEAGVVIFMIVRLASGQYRVGGQFYDSQRPGTQVAWGEQSGPRIFTVNLSVFVLIGSMSTAFLAHYNAPKFYHQLRAPSTGRFRKATTGGFSVALLLYATAMVVGYLTFGENCQGNILHNYSPEDPWATTSRLAMLLATICGFPLCFTGFRTATLALCRCDTSIRPGTWLVIGGLGSGLSSLGLVNALGGATLGSLIELVFPGQVEPLGGCTWRPAESLGLMIMWTHQRFSRKDAPSSSSFSTFEGRVVSFALAALGVVLLVFGTAMVLCIEVFHVQFGAA
eukprot:Skav236195  [mRNA]  locus=scaffold747:4642:6248:- [translate_table: standard]